MEKLHRQPDVSRQDYLAFVNELKLFHQNKGTPFRHTPKINGREIDLLKLYNLVTSQGGYQKVTEQQKWESVAEALSLPKSCVNFALSLRLLYIRFLVRYEHIHFMGEEIVFDKIQSSDSHHKKFLLTLFHQVPMSYNALQHELTDAARSTAGLNRNFVVHTDYDKLCMSLLCGLPNEQELALNVCTILSNEGNYMLHLEHSPKLVDLLIAQTGVWPLDDNSLKMLYMESWNGLKGRNMHKFWRNCLDLQNSFLAQLLGLDLGEYDPDVEILNLETDQGTLNTEGQRVLRVALILHNLSFERNNVPVLINNSNFIRFILLSSHSTWANLKQTAYDTLANIAYGIKLSIEQEISSKILFQTVMDGIMSCDRYMNIRSMDILSQLCNYEPNEDIIPSHIESEVYQKMVSLLTVHDILLLFYTLEALYALSDLGRYACDKIVSVHRCIGVFVSLLTVEPSQYGPSAQIKMKLVETMVPVEIYDHSDRYASAPDSSKPVTSSSYDMDSETLANNWLRSNYEYAQGHTVPRNEIYAEYVGFCGKAGRKGVVAANVFANYLKIIFPLVGLKKSEAGNGIITFHHDGLRRKRNATPVASPSISKMAMNSTPRKVPAATQILCKPGQKQTYSPILKAQLSAPPRSGVTSPPLKQPASNGLNCVSPSPVPLSTQAPVSPVATPPTGSSTLIKSLLANKVQQRNLQKQVTPSNALNAVVSYSDSVNPTGLRTGQSLSISSANIRTPIQANAVSNKGNVSSSSAGQNTLLAFKTPVKHTSLTVVPPYLNGVQKDIQMEILGQDEDSKSSSELTYTQITQMNCVQNHVNSDSFDTKDSMSCDGDSLASFKDSEVNYDTNKNFLFLQMQENSNSQKITELNENSLKTSKPFTNSTSTKEQLNGTNTLTNDSQTESDSLDSQHFIPPKKNPDILKSVLNEINSCEEITKLLNPKDKLCKKTPLLNGLLEKEKINSFEKDHSLLLQNGTSCSSQEMDSDDKSSTPSVQSNSFFSVSSPPKNSAVQTTSTPSLSSTSLLNSSSNSCATNISASSSSTKSLSLASDNSVQVGGPTTLSGTIEVQPDQKGVVRLHIESPETSHLGPDLSSISDITRTLECASKAISKTNTECNVQVPCQGTCETTATVTVITTNTSTTARTGQQIIVVTPAINQPQLHVQSPNIKLRILHSVPKADESTDLTDVPKVNANHQSQSMPATSETPSNSIATLKRPSSDNSSNATNAKQPRVDTNTPLLEATLRSSTPVPCSTSTKSHPDSILLKSSNLPSIGSTPKLSSAKAVLVQNADFPCEREIKTFSGLSSASDNPSLSTPSQEPPRSPSAVQKEFICEWKDCGLKFKSPSCVFLHASKVHAPYCNEDMVCQWEGCDTMKRRPFSLLTHIQDWHCSERVLHIQAVRRKQLVQQGKTTIAPPRVPPPHPGYAPDAALLAIRRHALQYINPKELSEEKESALTKSIRLTSALILRNLVTHSSLARTYVRRFEPELAYLAMSPVESARTIAQCLSHLSRPHD